MQVCLISKHNKTFHLSVEASYKYLKVEKKALDKQVGIPE